MDTVNESTYEAYDRDDIDWTTCTNEDELAEKLFRRFNNVLEQHKSRLEILSRNLRVYSSVDEASEDDYSKGYTNCRLLQMIGVSSPDGDTDKSTNTHSYNIIRVCVNTLANKIGKSVLNPKVLTSGANFNVREKCKMADTFIKSAMKKMKFQKEMRKILFDACLHGSGIGKICTEGNEIWMERVMLDEIFTEVLDAYYGDPSIIYQMKFTSRKELMQKYPKKFRLLKDSEALPFDAFKGATLSTSDTIHENVVILEAWSKEGHGVKGKGRHVIATSNAILVDEEWDKDYLTFIKLDYTPPYVGYFGEGIAHEVLKAQKDLTDIDQYINEAIHLATAPKTFYNDQVEIDLEDFNNRVGSLIPIGKLSPNMSPAQVLHTVSPSALSNEVYAYRSGKMKDAHDQCGISQMSATGMKPAGLDSGAALREYNDIQSERFATFGLAYEEFVVEATECIFKELQGLDYVVRNKAGTGLTKIRFQDLDIDFDSIEIEIYPVSALPETPAGRLATVKELQDAGVISADKIPDILKMPDLEGYFDIELAPKRYIDKFLNRLLRNNKGDFSVDPMMDLDYLYAQCVKYYNYVRCDLEDTLESQEPDEEAITKGEEILAKLAGLANAAKQMKKEAQGAPTPPQQGEAQAPQPADVGAQMAAMEAAGGLPPEAGGGAMMPPMPQPQ